MIDCVYILTTDDGSRSELCRLLTDELVSCAVEYKLISPAMCQRLYAAPTAIVIPATKNEASGLKQLFESIPKDILDSCPIFTLVDDLSPKLLPTALQWRTIINVSKLPELAAQLKRLLPRAVFDEDSVNIFGKCVKKDCKLLDLSGGGISDISQLAKLVKLRGAFLQQNNIQSISALEKLTELRMLFLYGNMISDLSPLCGLKELGILYLFSNRITDISPLADLGELFDLRLASNRITDISPLSGLKKLRTLHISGNSIGSLDRLSELHELRELNAAECELCDINVLSGLSRLEALDLCDNRITDVSCLSALEKLGSLRLYGNPIPREQIDFLRGKLPLCEILY